MFYFTPACRAQDSLTSAQLLLLTNLTFDSSGAPKEKGTLRKEIDEALESANKTFGDSPKNSFEDLICRRETSLLFVLLMLGTRKFEQTVHNLCAFNLLNHDD